MAQRASEGPFGRARCPCREDLPITAMIPQRSARALVARTCRCHPEAIAWTRYAVTLGANRQRPQSQVEGMAGQLGQVTLDVAEGESRSSLLGVLEQVGGQQLGTLDHAHGENRGPARDENLSFRSVGRISSVTPRQSNTGCGDPVTCGITQIPSGTGVAIYQQVSISSPVACELGQRGTPTGTPTSPIPEVFMGVRRCT